MKSISVANTEIMDYLLSSGVEREPEAVVILGSGLGGFSNNISDSITIPYNKIPHVPSPTVQGHSGELIYGTIKNKKVLAFSGRFHHYEGHDFETTVLPVSLASAFGAKKLIISNAAGAVNKSFSVGDLMVINDIF
ncbi:MAG: purine-nucleoside phosphorylase, partial [Balneolaceae bacterium]